MRLLPFGFVFLFFVSLGSNAQQLLSPSQFFNHETGAKFNFHSQLVAYHRYVAAEMPSRVKILPYGFTTEGRPLFVLAIGSEKHIANLDNIRQTNLRNIGLLEGSPSQNIPAIAMLSYNVHGNEAVNAQTAVEVVYELANMSSELSKKVLANTVVLIDPCVNPDGFDRYAQWYNRYLGTTPDLNQASIEHHEPWPGGRFNHYLFDMNRDLAWQTQLETQQRIRFYNSWMPHLHADFHEMGPNTTYYFPPSAKPFHEDLTVFQRQFQELLGQYNKKTFDEKGWLYYTKENYDLLYPSYGDTYPSYNGAIAMTFEQGGGGPAGLSFLRNDGDTLTLKDRISHSFTTSLHTLLAVSDKSNEVIEAFVQYFAKPQKNGFGKYKSFILKTEGNRDKVKALTQHLDRLMITYTFSSKKIALQGYNYSTQNDETFQLEPNDVVVNTFQPKGVLAKILFEPATMLEDSNTYDITAWALPYAYNIKAFGVTQKLVGDLAAPQSTQTDVVQVKNIYAYAVEWKSFDNARLLANLLQQNIKVRRHETGFNAQGKRFGAGTLLITRKGNEALGHSFEAKLEAIFAKHQIETVALSSGLVEKGSDLGAGAVDIITKPKVALLMGAGVSPTAAGDVWHYFDKQLSYPITLIEASYFSKIDLGQFQVLILPAGHYQSIIKDHKELTKWVAEGGRLILLESAAGFFAGKEGIELNEKVAVPETNVNQQKAYGNRERDALKDQIPGSIYRVSLDNTHPLAFGYEKETYILLKNVINYDFLKNGWNVGQLGKQPFMSGFVGKNVKDKLKDLPVFAVQELGAGKIIYLLESPIFRGFWYGGKLLFANAIFMVN
jgi:Zinc carboxypeptidase